MAARIDLPQPAGHQSEENVGLEETVGYGLVLAGTNCPCGLVDVDVEYVGTEPAEVLFQALDENDDVTLETPRHLQTALPVGRYLVTAKAPRHQRSAGRPLEVVEDQQSPVVTIQLEPGETLSGQVVWAPGEDDPEPTHVTVLVESLTLTANVAPDEQGWFEVDGVAPGSYRVTAWHPRLGMAVEVHDPSIGPVTLTLLRRPPLRGQVVDERGHPVAGAQLRAVDRLMPTVEVTEPPSSAPDSVTIGSSWCDPAPDCWAAAVTDADGRFSIEPEVGADDIFLVAWTGERRGQVLHTLASHFTPVTVTPIESLLVTVNGPERDSPVAVVVVVEVEGVRPWPSLFAGPFGEPIEVPLWPGLSQRVPSSDVCLRVESALPSFVDVPNRCSSE